VRNRIFPVTPSHLTPHSSVLGDIKGRNVGANFILLQQVGKMISKCVSCGYTYTHTDNLEALGNYPSFVESHYTCICMLFEKSVVCCVRGYSNLLNNVPILSLYTSSPMLNYEQWRTWSTLGSQPKASQTSRFLKTCVGLKKAACKLYLDSMPTS